MNFKSLFTGKKFGFYVSLALVALMLITGIAYTASFAGTRDFNIAACVVMFVGFALSLALVFIKQGTKYLPYVAALFTFASLLCFVNGVYLYVSEVMVGIDETEFSAGFIASTVFYLLTFVVGIVNVFFPQVKEVAKNEEETKEVAENE